MSKSTDALRRKWITYWRARYEDTEAGRKDYSPIPEEFCDLCCGARTRAGTPCKMRSLFRSGRCKLHGGMSTGPRSEEGKAKSAQNAKRRGLENEPHKQAQQPEIVPGSLSGEHLTTTYQAVDQIAVDFVSDPVSSADGHKDLTWVRCVDCAHMSAGNTCMLGIAGALSMGAIRECALFRPETPREAFG